MWCNTEFDLLCVKPELLMQHSVTINYVNFPKRFTKYAIAFKLASNQPSTAKKKHVGDLQAAEESA